MKDLGDAKRILGMDIKSDRSAGKLWLYQHDYVQKVLRKFNMHEAKSVTVPLAPHFKLSDNHKPKTEDERREMSEVPYSNIVGSIMYTMVCTRPDLSHAISVASRYMANPGKYHWEALRWILRYLKGNSRKGILFQGKEETDQYPLIGYTDSDYAVNIDNRRSQSGYIFNLYGSAISWKSTLQSVVALSTIEAEYMAVTETVKEAIWLKGMTGDFGILQESVVLNCDSQSALHLTKHQVFHERSKHIDVRLHFVRDILGEGAVKMKKVSTEDNAADMLTKSLPSSKFGYCLKLVNLLTFD